MKISLNLFINTDFLVGNRCRYRCRKLTETDSDYRKKSRCKTMIIIIIIKKEESKKNKIEYTFIYYNYFILNKRNYESKLI